MIPPTFSSLPVEVVSYIIDFLPPHEVASLRLTSRGMQEICSDDRYWKNHVVINLESSDSRWVVWLHCPQSRKGSYYDRFISKRFTLLDPSLSEADLLVKIRWARLFQTYLVSQLFTIEDLLLLTNRLESTSLFTLAVPGVQKMCIEQKHSPGNLLSLSSFRHALLLPALQILFGPNYQLARESLRGESLYKLHFPKVWEWVSQDPTHVDKLHDKVFEIIN